VPRLRHFDFDEDDVLLRIAGDPADVLARVREEVRALAPNLPVSRLPSRMPAYVPP
jgi:hypothetical protein